MKAKTKKPTPQQRMTYILKRCALELDHSGELRLLADEMGISPGTITRWQTLGVMPRTKARWLERRFGKMVPVELITRRG